MAKRTTKKLYSFDDHPEHKARLNEHRDKWIAIALRTMPQTDADRDACRVAVRGLYEAAKLDAPSREVFCASPIGAAIAAVVASCVWWLREHQERHLELFGRRVAEAELMGAIGPAVEIAVRAAHGRDVEVPTLPAATDAATRVATSVATNVATFDATNAATAVATRDATDGATRATAYVATVAATAATAAATSVATNVATFDATNAATAVATRDATRDATDGATRATAYVATVAATAATAAATDAATRVATAGATHDVTAATTSATTYAATAAATDAATRVATAVATAGATYATTSVATLSPIVAFYLRALPTTAATNVATADVTDDATTAATDVATAGATYATTSVATRAATLSPIVAFYLRALPNWGSLRNGGNQWAGWCAYLSFFREVADLKLPEYSKWIHYEKAAIHGGPRFMHPKFWIVSDFPTRIGRDERNQPHSATGPAIAWSDGWAAYYWHGVKVPREWIESPSTVDPALALTHPNVEQRRCLAEILGWDRVLGQLNARTIDTDPESHIGELVEVEIEGERERFLRVVCGTGRRFAIPVPPETRTAIEAQAWMHDVDVSVIRKLEART